MARDAGVLAVRRVLCRSAQVRDEDEDARECDARSCDGQDSANVCSERERRRSGSCPGNEDDRYEDGAQRGGRSASLTSTSGRIASSSPASRATASACSQLSRAFSGSTPCFSRLSPVTSSF